MNQIQNERNYFFIIKQNGCSFGFIEESHDKMETRASFIPNFSSIQNSDFSELKPENTSKIIMFKYFSLEFTICIAVALQLSHKKSNFAIPTSMMNLRKQKISRSLIVYFKMKFTQH